MNRLPLLILAGFAVAGLFAPTYAPHTATYCLVGELDQCRFSSLEQCPAAANGVGGFCVIDSSETAPPRATR